MARVMNVQSLREKRFHTISDLSEYWQERLGMPERNMKIAIVGPSTSGKSSFALQLANELANVWGKTLYNSYEEGHNATLQKRIVERDIHAKRLYVADRMPFEELYSKIKTHRYRTVVIDSVKFMKLSEEQYRKLITGYPRFKSFIFIGHGDSEGQMEGNRLIWQDADIKIWIEGGKAKITSRYSGEVKQFLLFKVKQITQQPNLF